MPDFRAYLSQLQRARADLPVILSSACKGAILRAQEAAVEATPTNKTSTGANTSTGELRNHWSTEGPEIKGTKVQTVLANDLEYASYVNDGHRMDRHFVPGLYINTNSGLLEYDPSADVGITVGTQTSYVEGVFMTDKAKKAYHETLETELHAKVKELMK